MARNRIPRAPFILAMVIVSLALLPSCRRAPEEPVVVDIDSTETPQVELTAIELPLQNLDIGITLNDVPPGLVATLNTEKWIEVSDTKAPTILYAFVASLPVSQGISPQSVAEFEAWVESSPDGKNTGNGSIDTALGSTTWASGTYLDDDGLVDDIHAFAPHPSGSGTLILYSVCPAGVTTVDERLAVMQELLTHVS
jgi:hypothetical protein